ncbi:MAG: hypothetical protein GXP22_03475 [Gammaproteobacteria bacterium]|nr:hypothetical protein [Gammaproteobacteria bacterium]
MSSPINTSPAVYTDFNSLTELRGRVRDNDPEAVREVADQFEAMFVQMMLKSMRDATEKGGLFDNDQSKLYQGMFDKQISMEFTSGKGIGISDMLVNQLSGRFSGITNQGRTDAVTAYQTVAKDTPPATEFLLNTDKSGVGQ